MRIRLLSAVAVAILSLGVFRTGIGAQGEDTEPPRLVEFDFDPKVVDTSLGPQAITVTARITDDLSGVGDPLPGGEIPNSFVFFASPERQQSGGESFNHLNRVSGDKLDGIYVVTLALPQYSRRGTWQAQVGLLDAVHNRRQYEAEDLAAAGFPSELINGEPNTPTPTLTATHTPTPAATATPLVPPSDADILLVFDTTGTMDAAIEAVQDQIAEIISSLQDLIGNVRFGVVDIRDYPHDPYGLSTDWPYRLSQPLTYNTSDVWRKIDKLVADGGVDGPEAYTRALYEAYADERIGWSPDAYRFIVMFGDSVPHDDDLNTGIPTPQPIRPGEVWQTGYPPAFIDPGRDAEGGTDDDLDFQLVLSVLHDRSITLLFVMSDVRLEGLTMDDLLIYWQTWASMTGPGGTARAPDDTEPLPQIIRQMVENAMSILTPTATTTPTATVTPTPTSTSTPTPTPTPTWKTIRIHAEGDVRLDQFNGPGVPNVQVNLYLFYGITHGTPIAFSFTNENGFYSFTATYGMPYGGREAFSVYPAQSEMYSFEPEWAYSGTCFSDCSLGGIFVAHPKRPLFLPFLTVQKSP